MKWDAKEVIDNMKAWFLSKNKQDKNINKHDSWTPPMTDFHFQIPTFYTYSILFSYKQ